MLSNYVALSASSLILKIKQVLKIRVLFLSKDLDANNLRKIILNLPLRHSLHTFITSLNKRYILNNELSELCSPLGKYAFIGE